MNQLGFHNFAASRNMKSYYYSPFENFEPLAQQLKRFKLKIKEIPPDHHNSCQFDAILDQIIAKNLEYAHISSFELRTQTCEWMRKNKYHEIEEMTIENWIQVSYNFNLETYLGQMKKNMMGDFYTLFAMAHMLNLKIHLFKDRQKKDIIGNGRTNIYIGYFPEMHYVSTTYI